MIFLYYYLSCAPKKKRYWSSSRYKTVFSFIMSVVCMGLIMKIELINRCETKR